MKRKYYQLFLDIAYSIYSLLQIDFFAHAILGVSACDFETYQSTSPSEPANQDMEAIEPGGGFNLMIGCIT